MPLKRPAFSFGADGFKEFQRHHLEHPCTVRFAFQPNALRIATYCKNCVLQDLRGRFAFLSKDFEFMLCSTTIRLLISWAPPLGYYPTNVGHVTHVSFSILTFTHVKCRHVHFAGGTSSRFLSSFRVKGIWKSAWSHFGLFIFIFLILDRHFVFDDIMQICHVFIETNGISNNRLSTWRDWSTSHLRFTSLRSHGHVVYSAYAVMSARNTFTKC